MSFAESDFAGLTGLFPDLKENFPISDEYDISDSGLVEDVFVRFMTNERGMFNTQFATSLLSEHGDRIEEEARPFPPASTDAGTD